MAKSELKKLKNLGDVSVKMLNSVDIFTKADLEKLGAVNVYHILKAQGYEASSIMVYALYGAINNLHWNEIPDSVKKELKKEINNSPFEDFKVD